MFVRSSRQAPDLPAAARQAGRCLRGLAAVLAAVSCALMASSAIVPAAFAYADPPGAYGGGVGVTPPTPVHVVTASGMAGWQITLIAVGAALAAATVAVLLDRARATRRAGSTTTA
jgi:hypothetical protein